MERSYVWQAEYGKRGKLVPILEKILDEQDASSLELMGAFVNNNPYNLEFYINVIYDVPKKNHIEAMIELFESAGLILCDDITTSSLIQEMRNRRFNACMFVNRRDLEINFERLFYFPETKELENRGYCIRPFEKEKQIFISHSSKDKTEVERILPYLNAQNLPVWFDKYNISVGDMITESVQQGIEESNMVIFWVTENFLNSKWCKIEMSAYIKRLIEEEIRMIIVLDDAVDIERLPLFVRDIKHIRKEGRDTITVAEEIAKCLRNMGIH